MTSPLARAVFLDRDGVINRLVLNPATGQYESPLSGRDLLYFPGTADALRELRDMRYHLFLISNQPNVAKGKSSLEELQAIHRIFQQTLEEWEVPFDDYFYCYHHPDGIRPGFSGPCACRKPGTLFVEQAIRQFSLLPAESWLIGDRESDILCGRGAGLKTILILEPASADKRGTKAAKHIRHPWLFGGIHPIVGIKPDFSAPSLLKAVEIIKRNQP